MWKRVMAVCAVVAARGAIAQTTVTLHASATGAPGAPIRVADVAALEGPESGVVGPIVVVTADQAKAGGAGGRVDVSVAQVRAAMTRADVNWGKVTLSGQICSVKVAAASGPRTAAPAAGAVPKAPPVPEAVDLSGAPTVRTQVALSLAAMFRVEPEDLRLKFRAEDEMLLSTPISGRRVDVQPTGSAANSRLPVQVYVYAGDRIVAAGVTTVDVLVRREVYTATGSIERGTAIVPEQVAVSRQWVEPNAKAPAVRERIVGSVARTKLNAGQVFTDGDLEPPLAAKRGELIWVHCLSGGVSVKAKARTLADARDGEVVQLRIEGSKKTFTARMSGAGLAVVDLGSEP